MRTTARVVETAGPGTLQLRAQALHCTMPTITTPTVGRKVWYRPSDADIAGNNRMTVAGAPGGEAQPLDATVIAVWGDRMVNLLVTDIVGKQYPRLSVTLVQDGDTKPTGAFYCEWMPYQIAQASAVTEIVTGTATHAALPTHPALAAATPITP